MGMAIFGAGFPFSPEGPGLYSTALYYADLTQNGGKYAGEYRSAPNPMGVENYISDLSSGQTEPLDFTLFVPAGFDTLADNAIPNIEVTADPAKILTASFEQGKEIWP